MSRLIVTGCGRSGTHWFAECLQRAGVPATHEHAFTMDRDGTQREWVCEVSSQAVPYLPVAGAEVVHLVRHPLSKISSSLARGVLSDHPPTLARRRLKRWVLEHNPEVARGRTTLERTVLQWVYWNRKVEPHSRLRLKVEDVTPRDVAEVARLVDPNPVFPDLPPPRNMSQHHWFTWQDVREGVRPKVFQELVDTAERYGYR